MRQLFSSPERVVHPGSLPFLPVRTTHRGAGREASPQRLPRSDPLAVTTVAYDVTDDEILAAACSMGY